MYTGVLIKTTDVSLIYLLKQNAEMLRERTNNSTL